ncbi:MAG TPA: FlgD immunoglobulin-like domain containing protein, partial [Candidatus Kapabacteria bacterium]|nr:FlgD immunoglobulin-like domain containing protein [Candidatus Kapabacteria bacterium]
SSHDTLADCWLAPALDPDLDGALASGSNDGNSYVDNALLTTQPSPDPAMLSQLREPYRSDLSKLNMAVQWRNYNQPPNGKQCGWLGVSFLESPVIDQANGNIIPNDDSSALNGYGPNSLFQKNQLGLVTCKDWTISNDPLAADLRYDFLSSGEKDIFDGNYADQRLMMATGPFTLLPDSSAEATIVLTFAKVDENDYRKNFGALLLLTDFAHQVFGEVTPVVEPISNDTMGYFVNNFQVTPPDVVSEQVRPSGLTIEPAYPDPFSTTCSIRYSNAVPGNVTVIVTDELGRKVRTHSLGEIPAGEHSLALDGAGLAAGDYRVTFFENGESQSLNVVYKP